MWNKIKDKYQSLDSNKKKNLNIALFVLVAVVIGYSVYLGSQEEEASQKPSKEPDVTWKLETKILEKKFHEGRQKELKKANEMYEGINNELAKLRLAMEEQVREMNDIRSDITSVSDRGKYSGPDSSVTADHGNLKKSYLPRAYQPFNEPGGMVDGKGDPGQAQPIKDKPPEVIGAIQLVSLTKEKNPEKGKKKVTEKIYLPPSFVEAHLLSGIDAPVMKEAKNDPKPMLLRLRDLAVLPNRLKADLKGCFVIAGGSGSLATERVDARLITLSCISKGGRSVIDTRIKGYLVDEDGKEGIRGKVVAKMGAMLGRSLLAGMLGGAGEYLESSTMTSMVSPIGVTSAVPDFNPEALARGAIGKGIARSTEQLQEFYIELARQTFPVIEVGSGRKVTAVISEGLELEIMDYQTIENCSHCDQGILQ